MALLLIDGDILVYQAISLAEQEIEWETDVFTLMTNLADAKDNLVVTLAKIIRESGIEKYHICLSDPNANWRKEVYPEYKANRKPLRKPVGFKAFRKWVVDSYPTIMKPKLEADDVLGILATKPGNDAVIWSIDKDLKSIPGKHLDKDTGKIIEVSEKDADYFHMLQTLTGDPVDGYPGCKGIGKVKAAQILDVDPIFHWERVVRTYDKAGHDEEFALSQARVARILRWDDWDQTKQEVKLWTPTLTNN